MIRYYLPFHPKLCRTTSSEGGASTSMRTPPRYGYPVAGLEVPKSTHAIFNAVGLSDFTRPSSGMLAETSRMPRLIEDCVQGLLHKR